LRGPFVLEFYQIVYDGAAVGHGVAEAVFVFGFVLGVDFFDGVHLPLHDVQFLHDLPDVCLPAVFLSQLGLVVVQLIVEVVDLGRDFGVQGTEIGIVGVFRVLEGVVFGPVFDIVLGDRRRLDWPFYPDLGLRQPVRVDLASKIGTLREAGFDFVPTRQA
jgi:hypothetical protein